QPASGYCAIPAVKMHSLPLFLLLIAGLCTSAESSAPRESPNDQTRTVSRGALQPSASVNVTQHHNNPSRDGFSLIRRLRHQRRPTSRGTQTLTARLLGTSMPSRSTSK